MHNLFGFYRYLKRNKLPAIINIIGLSIGLASFILIMNYVLYEFSYDKFHEKHDRIYRIKSISYKDGVFQNELTYTPGVLGQDIAEKIPEILSYTRFHGMWWGNVVSYKDKRIRNEDLAYFADNDIFKIFTFPLIQGDPNTALTDPNSVVITESLAKKFFGNEPAMGKELEFNTIKGPCIAKITGILEDIPQNSHLQFNMLLSFNTIYQIRGEGMFTTWDALAVHTYILLKNQSSIDQVETKIKQIAEDNYDPGKHGNIDYQYTLQPLNKIHLFSHLLYDTDNGDAKTVGFLFMVGIIILIITWTNYISLTIENSTSRIREIGIRKVIGSTKRQLITQFLIEYVIIYLIPIILVIIIIQTFNPFINRLFENNILSAVFNDFRTWGLLFIVLIGGVIIAGLYPSIVLSSHNPVDSLKGSSAYVSKKVTVKRIFVFFQYIISLTVIIATIIITKQVNHLQNIDLGINLNNVIVCRQPIIEKDSILLNKYKVLKQSLLNYPEIVSVATASSCPGTDIGRNSFRLSGQDNKTSSTMGLLIADDSYLELFGLELLEGRFFSDNFNNEKENIIFNMTAVNNLGVKKAQDILEKGVNDRFRVIGVLKDFHYQPPKYDYIPIAVVASSKVRDFIFIKIKSDNIQPVIGQIKSIWEDIFSSDVLDYSILKDDYEMQYKTEKNFSRIFLFFVIIAICISCMGQAGLSLYETKRSIKAAGIRKVYCANTWQIYWALTKKSFNIQLIASIISWCIAYFLLNNWLNGFASRINITISSFILATGLLLFIYQLIAGYFILRVVFINPVSILREE